MDDDQDPVLLSDDEEHRESPLFVDQEHDESTPSESGSPESASLEQDASTSPEADDSESSQPDEDDEEEEPAEPQQPEGTHSPESEPAPGQDGSDHGEDDGDYGSDQSEDDNAGEGRAACGGAPCQEQCDNYERRLLAKDRRNEDFRHTIKEKNARIRVLGGRITDLAEQVRRLGGHPIHGGRRRRRPQRSGSLTPRGMGQWQNLLRRSISGQESYTKAWKSSQQTLNMPVDNAKTHPGILFVPRHRREVPDDMSPEADDMSPEGDPIIPEMPEGLQLPDNVLFRILDNLLWYEGYLCHCISRLDLHEGPGSFPSQRELGGRRTGIRGRFFFSQDQRTPVSLTHDTLDPNDVLAALLVSRKWCWYGTHVFFGKNTFAFSSLGEFGRAMKGWGTARVQRVQHVELTWLGGRVVRFNLPPEERQDARTQPLEWLCEMSNIRTLAIHIEETNRKVIRRRREPEEIKSYLRRKMAGKVQGRMTRALRCVRGVDYLTQLRGLHWFRAFNLDLEYQGLTRQESLIRDQSFTIDVCRAVTQEKKPSAAEESRPEKLDLLFPFSDQGRWNPEDEDDAFELVRVIYNEDSGYYCRENDLDLDEGDTSSQGTTERGESSNSDSSDDGEDDDSPPGPSRRRRPFTPAPSPSDAEEDEISDSESQHSVSDDPAQGAPGSDSGDSDAESVTTEVMRLRRLNQYLRDDESPVPSE